MAQLNRGDTVNVKASTVRALTYMPNGQRCETWLPAGLWKCDGECNVQRDRDSLEMVPALIMFRPAPLKHDGVWYVSPNAF